MKKWSDITRQPLYRDLAIEEKLQERERYFNRLVEEQGKGMSPSLLASEKNRFIKHTEDLDPSLKTSSKVSGELTEVGQWRELPSGEFEELTEKVEYDTGILSAFKRGIVESSAGLLVNKPEYYYEPEGFGEKVAYQYGQLTGDAPAMGLGAVLGSETPVTALAGAFAVPAAIKKIMKDKYEKGDVTSENFLERFADTAAETGKAWLTGAATGTAGKVAPFGLKTLSELGAMVTVGAGMEGRLPKGEDFIEAAAVISGLKLARNVSPAARRIAQNIKRRKAMRTEGEVTADKIIEKSREELEDTRARVEEPVIEPPKQDEFYTEWMMSKIEKVPDAKDRVEYTPELARNRADMDAMIKNVPKQFKNPILEIVDGDKKLGSGDTSIVTHDLKHGKPTVPVRTNELEVISEAPATVKFGFLGKWLDTAPRVFEKYGKDLKRLTYDKAKYARHNSLVEMKSLKEKVATLKKALNISHTNSKRIGIFAIAQQENGINTLRQMKRTYKKYRPLIEGEEMLSDREMGSYEFMRNNLRDTYLRLNAARRIAGQKEFPEVENYFTFMRNIDMILEEGYDPVQINKLQLVDNIGKLELPKDMHIHPRNLLFPFSKKRTPGAISPLEIDSFPIFEKYMKTSLEHIHFAPVIAKTRQLTNKMNLKDGSSFELVEKNKNLYSFLREWADTVAGKADPTPVYRATSGARRILQTLNKNLVFSVLGYNLHTVAVQPAAYLNTMTELNPRWAGRGIVEVLKPESRKFAMDNSRVLLGRVFDIGIKAMNEGLARKYTYIRDEIGKFGVKPIQELDLVTAQATWLGAYNKARNHPKLKMDKRGAIEYADDVVIRTQASAHPEDIARIQRNTLGKTLTQFQTFAINQFGFLARDVLGIKKKMSNAEKISKAAQWVGYSLLFDIFYEDILGTHSPVPNPYRAYVKATDEGKSHDEAMMKAVLEGAEIFPGMSSIKYGSSVFGPSAQYISDIAGKIRSPKTGRPALELIAKGIGVPGTQQIRKMIREDERKRKFKTGKF